MEVRNIRFGLSTDGIDEDMPFMDTTTFSWSNTKTSFKYGKLILMFPQKLF
jgi:hypothetical protein